MGTYCVGISHADTVERTSVFKSWLIQWFLWVGHLTPEVSAALLTCKEGRPSPLPAALRAWHQAGNTSGCFFNVSFSKLQQSVGSFHIGQRGSAKNSSSRGSPAALSHDRLAFCFPTMAVLRDQAQGGLCVCLASSQCSIKCIG